MRWEIIEGFGNYLVSDEGQIKNKKSNRILTPYDNGNGYKKVSLSKQGKVYRMYVHRLVALHFVNGYKEGLTVDHINAKRDDNNYKNLQWMTLEDNVKKAHYNKERGF